MALTPCEHRTNPIGQYFPACEAGVKRSFGESSACNPLSFRCSNWTILGHFCTNRAITASAFTIFFLTFSLNAESARPANEFVNSVGVNSHLSYTNSLYVTQFETVIKPALVDLHVRHIRDGMADYGSGQAWYYDHHNELAALGIHCDYITSIKQTSALMSTYASRVTDVEALEDPNEYDLSGDPSWATHLRSQVPVVFDAAKPLNLPAIGPSFALSYQSYRMLGDILQYMDCNNIHDYFAGRNPETLGWGPADEEGHAYGSIQWNLDQARADGPGTPVWATETGYDVRAIDKDSVSESTAAAYIPRLCFAHWNAGIDRTYLYELADDPSTHQHFGLLEATGVRRPAFVALSGLLRILADPGPFTLPLDWRYTLSGNSKDVQHTLLRKRDGTWWLALWVALPVPAHSHVITIAWTARPSAAYRVYTFDAAGNLVDGGHKDGSTATLALGDTVTLLKVRE